MAARIPVRVAILDDDEPLCRRLLSWLDPLGYVTASFGRAEDGLRYTRQVRPEIILLDLKLGGNGDGLVQEVRAASPRARIIGTCAFPDVATVVQAMRAGANDLLEKPMSQPVLESALQAHLSALGIPARSEEEFNRRLGARLRSVRVAADKTLADVSTAVGISTGQLSQIELGRVSTASWNIARLSAALNVPLSELYAGL